MSPGSGLGREAHVQEVGPVWVLTGPSNHTVLVGRGTLHQRLALQGPGWEGRKHRPVVSLGWGLGQPLRGATPWEPGAGLAPPLPPPALGVFPVSLGQASGSHGRQGPWGPGPGAGLGTSFCSCSGGVPGPLR